ncbi:helix-turn-helix domain-containing protein [Peribacillus sp. NPDC096379]|uniref:helix-turn-helix domain-containing protein n=1 Tax=Peribacillus sp. NPDC096379 TaxID=3364393 RepID=UPI0038085A08
MTTFGSRLRDLRKESGISQGDFGKLFSLSESTIGMYERDKRKPDFNTLEKFANYFGVSIDYLLTGVNNTSNPSTTKSALIEKDEKDIAKRMEEIKKDLSSQDGLMFSGEPLSEEAVESLMEAMEHMVRQTQRINKKYIPKKYRDKETE